MATSGNTEAHDPIDRAGARPLPHMNGEEPLSACPMSTRRSSAANSRKTSRPSPFKWGGARAGISPPLAAKAPRAGGGGKSSCWERGTPCRSSSSSYSSGHVFRGKRWRICFSANAIQSEVRTFIGREASGIADQMKRRAALRLNRIAIAMQFAEHIPMQRRAGCRLIAERCALTFEPSSKRKSGNR